MISNMTSKFSTKRVIVILALTTIVILIGYMVNQNVIIPASYWDGGELAGSPVIRSSAFEGPITWEAHLVFEDCGFNDDVVNQIRSSRNGQGSSENSLVVDGELRSQGVLSWEPVAGGVIGVTCTKE